MYEQTFINKLISNLTNFIQAAHGAGVIIISSDEEQTVGRSGDHKNEGHSKAGPPSKWNTKMELEVKAQRMQNRKVCFLHRTFRKFFYICIVYGIVKGVQYKLISKILLKT